MKHFSWSPHPRCQRRKLATHRASRWWFVPALALLSAVALAQVDTVSRAYHEGQLPRAQDAIKTLGPDLFGDQINLYDGSFSFQQTDVSLPGNSALRVAVSRKWAPRA